MKNLRIIVIMPIIILFFIDILNYRCNELAIKTQNRNNICNSLLYSINKEPYDSNIIINNQLKNTLKDIERFSHEKLNQDSIYECQINIDRLNLETPHILDSSLLLFQKLKNFIIERPKMLYQTGIAPTYAYMLCIERDYIEAEKILETELKQFKPQNTLDSIYYIKVLFLRAYARKQQAWVLPGKLIESDTLYDNAYNTFKEVNTVGKILIGPLAFFEFCNHACHKRDSSLLKTRLNEYSKIFPKDIKPFNRDYLWSQFFWFMSELDLAYPFISNFNNSLNFKIFTQLNSYQFHNINSFLIQSLVIKNDFEFAKSVINNLSNMAFGYNLSNCDSVTTPFYFFLLSQLHDVLFNQSLKIRNENKIDSVSTIFDIYCKKLKSEYFLKDEYRKMYFYNISNKIFMNQANYVINSKDIKLINKYYEEYNNYSNLILQNEQVYLKNVKNDKKNSKDSISAFIDFHLYSANTLIRFYRLKDTILDYKILTLDSSILHKLNFLDYLLKSDELKYNEENVYEYQKLTYSIYKFFLGDIKLHDSIKNLYIINRDEIISNIPFEYLSIDSLSFDKLKTWNDISYFSSKYNIYNSFNFNLLYNKLYNKKNNISSDKTVLIITDKKGFKNLNFYVEEEYNIMRQIREMEGRSQILYFDKLNDASKIINEYKYLHFIGHSDTSYQDFYKFKIAGNSSKINVNEFNYNDLKDKIITLSFCSSSKGENNNREGNFSMIHNFLKKGSNTILGTTMDVSDYYLNTFYREFYYNIDYDIYVNLKMTKQNLINFDHRFNHPKYLSSIKIFI